jgi:hypothetical protein
MEERVSGFRVRGSWEDVVAHGGRITRALRESDADEDALAEWDDWRPKAHEDLGEEVSEKTVEKASLERGAGERAGQAATEDLERASEHALESIEKAEGDGPEDILEKWEDALEYGLRAVDTTTRKAIRTLETAVYERVMTRFAPYYFDNELVSANLRETTRLEDGGEFVFQVNSHDDQLKEKVSQRLDMVGEAGRGDV